MKIRPATAIVVFLSAVAPAYAHRLDEYLQATTIAVEKDRVDFNLRMTPGIEVARELIAGIDTDGDCSITKTEERTYTARVKRDLSAAVDGIPLRLRLVSSSFPEVGQLTRGLGSILLRFEADVPPGGPTRCLTFENRHMGDMAVYLVNCILPSDPHLHIMDQNRNYSQSAYWLEFSSGDGTSKHQGPRTDPSGWRDPAGSLPVVEAFFCHGVRHILGGYDHLLFIAILVLGSNTLWDLVKVVTAFTLAHSITLTIAALDLAHLPGWVVEPVIAGSIVFAALQNIVWPETSRGHGRLAVAFFFGLFHGMGFAGGLLDVLQGLPREPVILAILGFSIGVEAGHQMVLLPLFGLLKGVCLLRAGAEGRVRLSLKLQKIGSAFVLAAGLYYVYITVSGGS